MDADRRLTKALEAATDALQHLSMVPDFSCLDCTHIDRLVGRVVDLPTEGNQRNSRRNLLVIRQWMMTEGPGVVLLEVLGQLYWRLGELNSKQFGKFKATLQQQQPYLSLIQDTGAVTLVLQRLQHIQRLKAEACQEFLYELSDLTGLKVDSPAAETQVSRSRSSSPFTPGSVQSFDSTSSQDTDLTSLIKYVPPPSAWSGDLEPLLVDFYMHGLCPGRTVATHSNTYMTLLRVANTSPSTRYALLSLSASYLSDCVPGQKPFYRDAALHYSTHALHALAAQTRNGDDYEGALAASMLLMHHDAVNTPAESSPLCWSCHATVFSLIPENTVDYDSDPALFMRAQLALARTAQTAEALRGVCFHAVEARAWYEGTPSSGAQRICTVVGVSPLLLSVVSGITSLAMNTSNSNSDVLLCAQLHEDQLQNMKQWTAEPQGPEHDVLVATAEAFRVAGLIYLRCRVYGMTRFHPSVVALSETLCALIVSLPVKGALYTAIYPVWPLFVAAVTVNSEQRDRLYQRVVPIREGDKNTLPAVLKRVSGMRTWLARQDAGCQRRDGWWDEMLSPGSSTVALGRNLLCLG